MRVLFAEANGFGSHHPNSYIYEIGEANERILLATSSQAKLWRRLKGEPFTSQSALNAFKRFRVMPRIVGNRSPRLTPETEIFDLTVLSDTRFRNRKLTEAVLPQAGGFD